MRRLQIGASMKNIYVYVDGSERSATAVRSAGQLANTFDAILTGFFVVPDVIAAAADYTPNGRVLEPMKGYFIGEYGVTGLFADLWPILAVAVLLLLLAGRLSARKTLA